MILEYYSKVFGSKSSLLKDSLYSLETNLERIFNNLPEIFVIKNKVTNDSYKIDLINDEYISYEEYVILSSIFHQYNVTSPNDVAIFDIVVIYDNGKKLSFNEYINEYIGVFKLIKSILFLDFFNSLGFLISSFDLFSFVPMFSEIPSLENRDKLINTKNDLSNKLVYLKSEYEELSKKYENFVDNIEKLKAVVSEIEFRMEREYEKNKSLEEEGIPVKPVLGDVNYYLNRVKKITQLISKIENTITVLKAESVKILSENRVDLDSLSLKVTLDKRINKYLMWKSSLKNLCDNYQNEIKNITYKTYDTLYTNILSEEETKKYMDYKNSIMVAESQRYSIMERLKYLKDEINSVQLMLMEIQNQLSSNFKPVDVEKIVTENFIKLDKEISLSERIQRFMAAFFSNLEQKSYLSLVERRNFIKKFIPNLKIKSLALQNTVTNNSEFLIIRG